MKIELIKIRIELIKIKINQLLISFKNEEISPC